MKRHKAPSLRLRWAIENRSVLNPFESIMLGRDMMVDNYTAQFSVGQFSVTPPIRVCFFGAMIACPNRPQPPHAPPFTIPPSIGGFWRCYFSRRCSLR